MKLPFFLLISLVLFSSCNSLDPDACACGQEISKPISDQDEAIMDACSQKGEAMNDKEKVHWFEDIMNCVE
jgi:hypothetical protein